MATSGDIWVCHKWEEGEVVIAIQWVEVRYAAKHFTTTHHNKEFSSPSVNSAEVEEPWCVCTLRKSSFLIGHTH